MGAGWEQWKCWDVVSFWIWCEGRRERICREIEYRMGRKEEVKGYSELADLSKMSRS